MSGLAARPGQRISQLLPNFLQSSRELFDTFARVARTGQAEKSEYFVPTLDRWFSISVYSFARGEFVSVFDDVTGRHAAEQRLEDQERYFHTLIDSVFDVVLIAGLDGRLSYINAAVERTTDYRRDDFINHSLFEFIHPDDLADGMKRLQQLARYPGVPLPGEYRIRLKSGEWRTWEVVSRNLMNDPMIRGILTTMRDITLRRQLQKQIEDDLVTLRTEQELSPDGILVVDQERHVKSFNERFAEMWAIPRAALEQGDADAILQELLRQCSDPDTLKALVLGQQDATATTAESEILLADGRIIDIRGAQMQGPRKEVRGRVWYCRDVTAGKRAERQLRLFRSLIDQSTDEIFVINPSTLGILDANDTACHELGYLRAEMLDLSIEDFDVPESPTSRRDTMAQLNSVGSTLFESMHRRKDGSSFPVEVSARQITTDAPYVLAISRDISSRKEAESRLRRVNHALRTLSACNAAVAHANSEAALYEDMCHLVVEVGGYRMVWIGQKESDVEQHVRPMAWAGEGSDYLQQVAFSWGDNALGRGGTGTAIRFDKPQVMRFSEPVADPWRDAAQKHGFAASISLPLRVETAVIGVLAIYSVDVNAFDEDEIKLLVELANNLSFGINSVRTRFQNEQVQLRLSTAMESTVGAIASMAEMRDPYTAGHQRRVAALCGAIARRMDMSEERIHGLVLAATIHDLGKINVPAEILCKPTRLTPIERQLIEIHAEVGYEILKGVDFPWPIAEMVRQHHERLDGSGYPHKLNGENILLEARIIAVADTVEAMSSHRPYRPGKGLEAALDEIRQHRGIAFDVHAVDACLMAFANDGFRFPD